MLGTEELTKKKEHIETLTSNFEQAEKDVIVLKTKIESLETKREELEEECQTRFGCKPEELPQLISKTSDKIEKLMTDIEATFGNVQPIQATSEDTMASGFNMFEDKGDDSNGF